MKRNTNTASCRDNYVAPRRTLIFVGVFLILLGGGGAWSFLRSLEPLTWRSAPCTVMRFDPFDQPDLDTPFTATTEFHFEWKGRSHSGNKLGISGWKESRDQWREVLHFEKNTRAKCYLPAGNPEQAVLFRPPPRTGGLAFTGFALCVGWLLYAADRHRHAANLMQFRHVAFPLMLLFGLPGVLLTAKLSVPVWVESIQSRSWTETPATIVWSRARETKGRRNRTNLHADICYEYQAGGRIWRQNRFSPGDLEISDKRSSRKKVAAHPPGKRVTCFVHPDDPLRSVLRPALGWQGLFTLFPLPFIAVGGIILRAWRKSLHDTK